LDKLIALFIDYLNVERGLAVNTLSAYRRDLGAYARFLETSAKTTVVAAGRDDIRNFMFHAKDRGLSVNSIARSLAALRMFYRFLARERLIKADVSSYIDSPRLWKRIPDVLSLEDVERLLEAPDLTTPQGIRDRAILETLYATGLRVSEAGGLKVHDVNTEVGFVRCFGKGRKERLVPLGKKAILAIARYVDKVRPSLMKGRPVEELFLNRSGRRLSRISLWKIVKAQAKRARLKKPASVVRDASFGARGGFAFGPGDVGAHGYFDDADLHARE
jgi:integrase/recombinase XerD